MYYSAKHNEFYGTEQPDTVLIADSICFALFSQKSGGWGGGAIVPDVDGNPIVTYPAPHTPDVSQTISDNYKALIHRRAAILESQGNQLGALLLLKQIGE